MHTVKLPVVILTLHCIVLLWFLSYVTLRTFLRASLRKFMYMYLCNSPPAH